MGGQGKNQDCKNTDCDWQEIRMQPTTAKYFRLFMVNNWGYGWLSIDQLELSLFDIKICKCSGGIAATGAGCPSDGAESCASMMWWWCMDVTCVTTSASKM